MILNPKDKVQTLLSIVQNEIQEQERNNGQLDSVPILELLREELKDLSNEVNDDWSLSSVFRRIKHGLSMRKSDNLIRTSRPSNTREALSLISQAMRDEANRYDSRSYSFWMSPLWQKLDRARNFLSIELEK